MLKSCEGHVANTAKGLKKPWAGIQKLHINLTIGAGSFLGFVACTCLWMHNAYVASQTTMSHGLCMVHAHTHKEIYIYIQIFIHTNQNNYIWLIEVPIPLFSTMCVCACLLPCVQNTYMSRICGVLAGHYCNDVQSKLLCLGFLEPRVAFSHLERRMEEYLLAILREGWKSSF